MNFRNKTLIITFFGLSSVLASAHPLVALLWAQKHREKVCQNGSSDLRSFHFFGVKEWFKKNVPSINTWKISWINKAKARQENNKIDRKNIVGIFHIFKNKPSWHQVDAKEILRYALRFPFFHVPSLLERCLLPKEKKEKSHDCLVKS